MYPLRVLLYVTVMSAVGFLDPVAAVAEPVDTTAVVLNVVDGDTIDVRDDSRGRLRIRVLGIFPVKWAC